MSKRERLAVIIPKEMLREIHLFSPRIVEGREWQPPHEIIVKDLDELLLEEYSAEVVLSGNSFVVEPEVPETGAEEVTDLQSMDSESMDSMDSEGIVSGGVDFGSMEPGDIDLRNIDSENPDSVSVPASEEPGAPLYSKENYYEEDGEGPSYPKSQDYDEDSQSSQERLDELAFDSHYRRPDPPEMQIDEVIELQREDHWERNGEKSSSHKKKNHRGSAVLPISMLVAGLAIGGAAGYWMHDLSFFSKDGRETVVSKEMAKPDRKQPGSLEKKAEETDAASSGKTQQGQAASSDKLPEDNGNVSAVVPQVSEPAVENRTISEPVTELPAQEETVSQVPPVSPVVEMTESPETEAPVEEQKEAEPETETVSEAPEQNTEMQVERVEIPVQVDDIAEEQPEEEAAEPETVYVKLETAELKTAPSADAEAVTTLSYGNEVLAGTSQDGWTQVTVGEQTGWLKDEEIARYEPGRFVATVSEGRHLNIRAEADVNSELIDQADPGEVFEISEFTNGWGRIQTGTTDGWASMRYLTPEANG